MILNREALLGSRLVPEKGYPFGQPPAKQLTVHSMRLGEHVSHTLMGFLSFAEEPPSLINAMMASKMHAARNPAANYRDTVAANDTQYPMEARALHQKLGIIFKGRKFKIEVRIFAPVL